MNNFLKTTLWASLVALTLAACGGDKPTAQADLAASQAKTVAITAIVEHPALDAARQGALDQLTKEGFKEGENLTVNFQSAQGNMATNCQTVHLG